MVLGYVICEIGRSAVARPLVEALAMRDMLGRSKEHRRLTGIVVVFSEA
jgi:hypothetical protein